MGCIVLDVIGIGLGPFNLSLAALLVQANESKKAVTSNITSLFFEKNSDFNWHEGMLLPKTTLQVPFFADLVTLVAPTSRYGFLNYLSHKKRLLKFYFLENFKIPRQEYNDYCQWAAHQLPNVAFDSHVKSVEKSSCGVGYVVTVIQNGISHRYHARHVVIGTGTQPTLPKVLQAVANDMPNRCMHSANFARQFDLSALKKHIDIPHILVIGSGQSSAEVYRHLLQQQYTDSKLNYEIDWVTRSSGFFPMEYSPLGLEHFSPAYTEYYYHLDESIKAQLLREQGLMYKGMGMSTIQDIYQLLYERTIGNRPQHCTLMANCQLDSVVRVDERLAVQFFQRQQQQSCQKTYDCIIAGTGYQHQFPSCMDALMPEVTTTTLGQPKISHDYRLILGSSTQHVGEVFVQNQELHSHGIGTPDLGLGAYRAGVIANQILGEPYFDTQALTVFQTFGHANNVSHDEVP